MEGSVRRGWGDESRAETQDKERGGETGRCWQADTDRKSGRDQAGAGGEWHARFVVLSQGEAKIPVSREREGGSKKEQRRELEADEGGHRQVLCTQTR